MNWITPEMYNLAVPVVEKILRSVLVYFALIVLLRVFGKRELAQLNPFDLVVLLTLSNTVQNAIIGNDNSLTGGLLGATTLLIVNYLVVRFLFRHRRLDQMVEGKPAMLIQQGKMQWHNLAKELMTESELRVVARRQSFELEDLEECVLEPGGSFSMRVKESKVEKDHWPEVKARLDAITTQLKKLEQRG